MTAKRDKASRQGSGAGKTGSGVGAVSPTENGPSSVEPPDGSQTAPAPGGRDDSADTTTSSATAEEQQERVERDFSELLADVERERDEYLELARRTKADFENYRKRVAGEASQAEKRGRSELARELLPVLDNLERALAAAAPGNPNAQTSSPAVEGTLAEGVRLVHEELARVLERSGVESYEPAGERFDPHWHEAMMARPGSPEDAGKVLEVLEKGYRLDGHVLRPARVVVGAEEQPSGSESAPEPGDPPSVGGPPHGSPTG